MFGAPVGAPACLASLPDQLGLRAIATGDFAAQDELVASQADAHLLGSLTISAHDVDGSPAVLFQRTIGVHVALFPDGRALRQNGGVLDALGELESFALLRIVLLGSHFHSRFLCAVWRGVVSDNGKILYRGV